MDLKAKTRLVNLITKKVSLVDKPANQRPFLVLKSEQLNNNGGANKMSLKKFEQLLEVEKGKMPPWLNPEMQKACGDMKAGMKGMSKEQKSALKQMLDEEDIEEGPEEKSAKKNAVTKSAADIFVEKFQELMKEKPGENIVKSKALYDELGIVTKSDGTPDIESIPEAMRPAMSAVIKLANKNAELELKVNKANEDRILSTLVQKAQAEFGNLPIKPEKMAAVLKAAESMDEETGKELNRVLKSYNELMKQTRLFQQIGTTAVDENSALGKLVVIAKQYVEKAAGTNTPLSQAEAMMRAMENNPDLYTQYEQECGRVPKQ